MFVWLFVCSVKEGLESYVHSSNITYELGCEVEGTSTDGFSAALAAAQQADLTILAVGINETIEAEGRELRTPLFFMQLVFFVFSKQNETYSGLYHNNENTN